MKAFEQFEAELQRITPYRIRYKDEAWEMQLLYLLVFWFCPDFLTRFTTVVGKTIYFPTRQYLEHYPQVAIRTLAHEAVHLLDQQRWGRGIFILSYLFPQIFSLGIFLFPFIGPFALLFLLFLAPWPAPFRAHFEARAYAMDYLTSEPRLRPATLEGIVKRFSNSDYYRMFPFPDQVKASVMHWVHLAESGKDPELLKVLLIYEMATEV